MRWIKGNARMHILRIPGTFDLKATITEHSESIVLEIRVNHVTVRKECFPSSVGVEALKKGVECGLNELAQRVWEG